MACLEAAEELSPFLVSQMKMPSKKYGHIPVYTLGFESLQRVPTTKATPTLRRDAFQYVLLLVSCGSEGLKVTGKLGPVPTDLCRSSQVTLAPEAAMEETEFGWLGAIWARDLNAHRGRAFVGMNIDCRVDEEGEKEEEGEGWRGHEKQGLRFRSGRTRPLGDPSPGRVLSSHGSFLASLHSRSLQGPKWRSVEEEFPHIYAHGCVLKDVCSDCTSFVADVVCSSRKSVDVLNATPRRSRQTQSLYIPNTRTLNFQ